MLRKIFPRTLLLRSLLIVIAPIILIQIVVGVVFFDSIWFKTNKGLVRSAIGEINTFLVVYPDFKEKKKINELIKQCLIKKIHWGYINSKVPILLLLLLNR